MIDHGKVRSTVAPEPIVVDEFSVWVHSNITPVEEDNGEETFVGFEYGMVQYDKDEYISKLTSEDDAGMLALIISLLMAEIDILNARVSRLEEVK